MQGLIRAADFREMARIPVVGSSAVWVQIECLAIVSLGCRPVPLEIRQQEGARNIALSQIIIEGEGRRNLGPGSL